MNKEEIIKWLKNNSEKPDQEIENYLRSEIANDDSTESGHIHYLLEDLKLPENGFSKRVLKLIKNIQKEVKQRNKPKKRWGWIIISYLIYVAFKDAKTDENHLFVTLLMFIGIITIPLLYYKLRDKFTILHFIKSEGIRNFIIGVIFTFIGIFLISFLGAVGDRFILGTSDNVDQIVNQSKTELADDWEQIISPDGKMIALVPKDWSYVKDKSPDKIDNYTYIAKEDGGSIAYVLKYENYQKIYDENNINIDPSDNYELLNELLNISYGEAVLSNKKTQISKFGKFDALKFSGNLTLENESVFANGILILANKKLYTITAINTFGKTSDLDRLLTTLTINE